MALRILVLFLLVGCGRSSYAHCDDPPVTRQAQVPPTLRETGLHDDPTVQEYAPRFEAWADGATKRRWIALPPGAKIDTTVADAWQFPEGTRLWKEFSVGGAAVETRYLHKVGPRPDDWAVMAYVDGLAAPEGAENLHGTTHDAPPAKQCQGCHGGTPGRVLGFAAVQLDAATLARFSERFSVPVTVRPAADEAARGYLHANCAHCHNQVRPAGTGARCFDPRRDFDLSLHADGAPAMLGDAVVPGDPDASALVARMEGRAFGPSMPALGTEIRDEHGVALLRAWISSSSR